MTTSTSRSFQAHVDFVPDHPPLALADRSCELILTFTDGRERVESTRLALARRRAVDEVALFGELGVLARAEVFIVVGRGAVCVYEATFEHSRVREERWLGPGREHEGAFAPRPADVDGGPSIELHGLCDDQLTPFYLGSAWPHEAAQVARLEFERDHRLVRIVGRPVKPENSAVRYIATGLDGALLTERWTSPETADEAAGE